jgi:hypothetical protein
MHADFIAWMEKQDGLFDAMNAFATISGSDAWKPMDYFQRSDVDDSAYAVSIFDIANDLTPFLPEGHMFGFSEGRVGIFHCPITIVEVEEKPKLNFKFLYADPGKCRTYYRALYGAKLLYCFQDDGRWGEPNINFYLCSKDGEPDVQCVMPENSELDFVCKP